MHRPAYLEQSALRRFLHAGPEIVAEPATRSSSAALSFVSDSDEDAREARGTPTPEPTAHTPPHDDMIRVPTRWNPNDKYPSLVLSGDGREVRYPSTLPLSCSACLLTLYLA